ncbi:MAG: DUF6288 domain-containing protein [Verrucomicrobia bacterium]|nr:DUF6288 domain-containing protein [Verrucomicrobiota bacterium]
MMTMKKMMMMMVATLLAGVLSASGAEVTSDKFESKYYKDLPLFSTAASETVEKQPIEHFGPVGIGIDLLLPPFQMQLSRIDKGSPAEATGKLKVGQMIESINGEKLKDIDPRIQLGAIITKVEATDGVIRFMVKEKPDATAGEVIVKIPVLGAYSKTWPLNCPKSDKIVRGKVATVEEFTSSAQLRSNPLLPAKLTFAANGRTDDPLVYYTGDLLMHLNTNQALKMSMRTTDGVEYLFIEAGGFAANTPPTWKPRLIVMKRGG